MEQRNHKLSLSHRPAATPPRFSCSAWDLHEDCGVVLIIGLFKSPLRKVQNSAVGRGNFLSPPDVTKFSCISIIARLKMHQHTPTHSLSLTVPTMPALESSRLLRFSVTNTWELLFFVDLHYSAKNVFWKHLRHHCLLFLRKISGRPNKTWNASLYVYQRGFPMEASAWMWVIRREEESFKHSYDLNRWYKLHSHITTTNKPQAPLYRTGLTASSEKCWSWHIQKHRKQRYEPHGLFCKGIRLSFPE